MKKLIFLIISILLLSACSTNGVYNSLYKESKEVIRIINQLHIQGEYNLDEKDKNIVKEFTGKYPSSNIDGNNKTKDKQLVYDIYYLSSIDNNYRQAYESNDIEAMNKTNEKFKTVMNKIKSDYGIELENK